MAVYVDVLVLDVDGPHPTFILHLINGSGARYRTCRRQVSVCAQGLQLASGPGGESRARSRHSTTGDL